MVMVVVDDSCL